MNDSRATRDAQADATKKRLQSVGYDLFGTDGYANVSSERIAATANVTRGALYHHFKAGKLGLFEAVATQILVELVTEVTSKLESTKLNWDALRPALEVYFDAAMVEQRRRIALQDAPSVLGVETWRVLEYRYSVMLIEQLLTQLMERGVLQKVAVTSLASVLFGACCEAISTIAAAKNHNRTKQEMLDIILQMLGGFRA